jgi:hypothetical protein
VYYYYPNDDDQTCPTTHIDRRYLRVTIAKNFTPFFGFLWSTLNADGSRTINGATSVRVQ